MKRFVFAVCLCFLGACSSAPSTPAGTGAELPGETPAPSDPALGQLLKLVNEARAAGQTCGDKAYGAAPALSWHATLGLTAQKHSEDMAIAGDMSHTTPQGAVHYRPGMRPFERVAQEGYAYSAAGENVARGYPTPEAVMRGWLSSPGHCGNIMNAGFREIGLGLEESFWTQVFGAPR